MTSAPIYATQPAADALRAELVDPSFQVNFDQRIPLSFESFDPADVARPLAPGEWLINRPGLYSINSSISVESLGGDSNVVLELHRNGTPIASQVFDHNGGTPGRFTPITLTHVDFFDPGDRIELFLTGVDTPLRVLGTNGPNDDRSQLNVTRFNEILIPNITAMPGFGAMLDLGTAIAGPIQGGTLLIENTGDATSILDLDGISGLGGGFSLFSGDANALLVGNGVNGSGPDIEALLFEFDPTGQSAGLHSIPITLGFRDFGSFNFTLQAFVIPEPSTFALAALGLLSLGMIGRRRRQR